MAAFMLGELNGGARVKDGVLERREKCCKNQIMLDL
jgi:hypothetical protein